ncbi:MAG: cytochrome P450 [Vicinamibacterales bacterium]
MRPPSITRTGAPGPAGHVLFGHLGDLRRNPLGFFTSCARDYGPVVRLRAAAWSAYLVSHPDLVKHVLQDNARNYSKQNVDYRLLKPVTGDGLLTSEGAHWYRQRRALQPAFDRQRMATLNAAVTRGAAAMLDRWDRLCDGARVELTHELARPIITIVGETLFGSDLTHDADRIDAAFRTLNERFGKWTAASFLPFLVTPGNLRCHRALRTLNRVAARMMAEWRPAADGPGHVLSLLLPPIDAMNGAPPSRRQVRDEIVTFLLAGYETTVTALTWTCYLVARHPAVDERIQEELREVAANRTVTAEDLPRLTYTRMVIEESMRLYPPVWVLSRSPLADDCLDGHRIQAGSIVFLSPYVTHRLPEWWSDAERFLPERFSPERSSARPRFSYFPFGGGPRVCIGRHFGMTQAQLVLAMMLQRYRVTLPSDRPVEPVPLVTLRPRNGLHVELHRRP